MEFRILGPLEVWSDGARISLRGRRQELLLGTLLCDVGRVVPVGRLAAAVWGARAPATAERQVRNQVAVLRRLLITAGAPHDVISTEAAGYALRVDPDLIDGVRFERLAAEARLRQGADAAAAFRTALALWRGEAFAGLGGEVLGAEAARLTERRLAVWEECLVCELGLGRHADLVAELAVLADEHPFRERFTCLLMLALYRCGRQSEALDAYHRLRVRLAGALGLDPDDEPRRMHEAILRRDPALDLPLARTDHPQRTPWPHPAQLPPDVPGFTGRSSEIARLQAENRYPIQVITGMAGVGKTALAVHWAHRIAHHFPDGQLYSNLRAHGPGPPLEATEVLGRLLRALDVTIDQAAGGVEERSALFRSVLADRKVLILLDDAASAEQVRPLLPAGTGSVVLVTSRLDVRGLVAVGGARSLELGPMLESESIALFRQVLGDERVTAEVAAVTTVTRLCAHLPLALRIVAAELASRPQLTATGLAETLAAEGLSRLEVTGDNPSAVRASFDLSYDALPQPAQRLFRLSGLVPGPDFDVDAAAALTGADRLATAKVLERLVTAHLVMLRDASRYTLHDLLRRYAGEQTTGADSETDRVAAMGRLFDYYLHRAEAASAQLYPQSMRLASSTATAGDAFDSDTAALAWLDSERANLVAAALNAAEHGPRRFAYGLSDTLRPYFASRMWTDDWLAVAGAGERAARVDRDVRAEAAAVLSIGTRARFLSDNQAAVEHFRRAEQLTVRAAWTDGRVFADCALGNSLRGLGRPKEAAAIMSGALIRLPDTARPAIRAFLRSDLGLAHRELGRLALAAEEYEAALEIFRKLGSTISEAITLSNLGEVTWLLGQLGLALEYLTAARAMQEAVGDRRSLMYTLCHLAGVYAEIGRDADAYELAEAAIRLSEDTRQPYSRAESLRTRGEMWLRRGEPGRALADCEGALVIARTCPERLPEAEALVVLAAALAAHNQGADARDAAEAGLAVARQAGFRLVEGNALIVLADSDHGTGRTASALDTATRALDVHRETGFLRGQARAHAILAEVIGDEVVAAEHAAAAQRIRTEIASNIERSTSQAPAFGSERGDASTTL